MQKVQHLVRCAETDTCGGWCWRATPHEPSVVEQESDSFKCSYNQKYVKIENVPTLGEN